MRVTPETQNTPVGTPLLACPAYVEALLSAIRSEIARVYWNVHQQGWNAAGCGDIGYGAGGGGSDDPKIPGIEWHAYSWDADADAAQVDVPNFAFAGVAVRWYKYFGRGMTVNQQWTPDQWVAWFDRCLAVITAYDT